MRGHHTFFLKYSNNQMFLNIVNRKFGPINFLSTGTRRNTNMFNGPANLTKFDRRKSSQFSSFFLKYSNNQMFLNIANRKFGPINFLSTGTRRNTNMFNGPANLTKFDRRKSDKSYSKDAYLLCRKALRNGIELRQDRLLSMRRPSTLLPFGNLSLGVFFSVDPSFRRRRPMNITGAVA